MENLMKATLAKASAVKVVESGTTPAVMIVVLPKGAAVMVVVLPKGAAVMVMTLWKVAEVKIVAALIAFEVLAVFRKTNPYRTLSPSVTVMLLCMVG